MPTKAKLDQYTELLSRSVSGLHEYEKWKPFLETASRLYKYKFRDQIMIHAQRPNATACADYNLWKRQDLADRYVKPGSKGIAIFEDSGNRTNLRYVFDYADTEAKSDKKLFLWKIKNENEDIVADMLGRRYGADSSNLDTALLDTAKLLADQYGGDYANELLDYTEDTFLEELDDYNVWVEFSEILENSIACTLLARCGYNPAIYFTHEDFRYLHDFNGVGAMTILGKAVSELSETVLRDIEITVKNFERSKRLEQTIAAIHNRNIAGRNGTDLHFGHGNPNLPHEPDTAGTAGNRVLQQGEREISSGTETDGIRNNADKGDIEHTPDGNTENGFGVRGASAHTDVAVGENGRKTEINRPNEMGANDEQHQTEGKGNSAERTDIPLTTAEAERYGGFLLPETLDKILINDKSMNVRKPEILEYFLEYNDVKKRADFMKAAYNFGFTTFEVDGLLHSYQKRGAGLEIFMGTEQKTVIPWHTVQAHVAELISKHEYLDEPKPDIDITDGQSAFFMPEEQGMEQFSLFGESVEVQSNPKNAKIIAFSEADEQIIKSDLMRGSGFENGKFRIEEYAKTNPEIRDFAKFLRNEYGTGGHSGDGVIKFSDHDSKGICLRLYDENSPDGERKIALNWNHAAKRISELVRNGEYITEDDISRRIRNAEYVMNNYDPNNEMDLQQIEKAEKILALYGMFETEDNAQPDEIMETPDISGTGTQIEDYSEDDYGEYYFKIGDVLELDEGIFDVTGIDGNIIELTDTTTEEVCIIDENELYNTGFAVIEEAEIPKIQTVPEYEEDTAEIEDYSDTEDITDIAVDEPSEILSTFNTSAEPPKKPQSKGENYRITDENLGVDAETAKGFSPKEKFRNNIVAIKLLEEIEYRFGNHATPEEQEILSKYVGWGGLSQAFDENNSAWSGEYQTLKNLLSDSDYESARESTLNAHYTSPTVIRAIYEGLENLGFKSGNVLEPAVGVGNFFGMLPESMKDSKLYGVELDDISGRIAKLLYPKADISIKGFEEKQFSDNFFDLAVGNVPFGGYKLSEKRYDKLNLNVHDHFFAKALDKVRPGGVIAFVTSKGTLDKQNPSFRKYLAERADLLGAIRLPNTAFKANAGTEVTSDIIFLQKRDIVVTNSIPLRPSDVGHSLHSVAPPLPTRQAVRGPLGDIEPEWVNTAKNKDGITINKYFLNHPEMMLGTMSNDSGMRMYGNENSTTCVPFEGADLAEQLKAAIANIKGNIPEYEHEDEKILDSIPADDNVRNFSFTLIDGNLYYRENSRMNRIDYPKTTEERIKAIVELRDCVRTLIDYQLNEYGEADIKNQQLKLNTLYDKFNRKHGLINSQANKRAFSEDSSYYLLCSLEILNEQGELERKADMFIKRTIKQRKTITSVDTASEALAVSIGEKARVDLDFMQSLTGFDKEKLIKDLQGVIYKVPQLGDTENYVTADEYLSGNIREKLETARNFNESLGTYSDNVTALEQVMPKPLEASDIDVRLGANWVDTEYIKQFICETLQVSRYAKDSIDVRYFDYTAEWRVEGKNADRRNVLADTTFGTSRKNAYSIIEDSLNQRDVRIYDYIKDGDSTRTVLNKKETMLAQEKQELIKQVFKDWVFKDPDRRHTLVEKYNVMFNSTRPREYDGSHINFVGMNPEITLQPHQRNAVAHALYGGNTLFAHCVGAGKTFEMVATAMESKRLGLCNKSLMVVPNHITEQIGGDFLRLYPSANILVATKKDFEKKNRRRLCAKISTGDYDCVIIGHSQLEKIPVSPERQMRLINKQIHDITKGIEELKNSRGERFTVKQLEKTKKNLKEKLKKLTDAPKRDDVVNFEELGVNKLFVDESHGFKNLYTHTKMRNVAGVQQTEAQKATDLYLKCQYLDEITGGRGVTFSTGTPVSNSMTELYTVMRYLQADLLRKHKLEHFDSWAAQFGETVNSLEIAPEGGGYRSKTRFSKFFNLPDLMNLFKECADIKTADMLPDLKVPEVTFHNVVVQPTEHQKEMIKELSERAKLVRDRRVDSTEDNMLRITGDGRKIGLDQRLMNPLLPDEENTKVNMCVNNIFGIWEETAPDKLTQILFCDFSTPKSDGTFNLYDDVREKLISKGVPKEEIAFIHDADSEEKKKELFAKVRKGQVRVLLGSTAKMGSGTNIQDKLIALHDLDAPWRPADLSQRLGRIERQGNENPAVSVFRYVTESTFDSYLYQTLENKQRYISQIMTSKSPVRSCEDVDELTLSYAEVKALCTGNPLIKEKIDLDVSVAKLRALKANHINEQYRLEDDVIKHFPEAIRRTENCIKGYEIDLERIKNITVPEEQKMPVMTVFGKEYTDKETAGTALIEACKQLKSSANTLDAGNYKGFALAISYDSFNKAFNLELKGDMTYKVALGTDPHGNIQRINNALDGIQNLIDSNRTHLETLQSQLETAKGELGKPFPREDELNAKSARLAELNIQLNIDGKQETEVTEDGKTDNPEKAEIAAEKMPTVTEKTADRPPESIQERMKYYKAIADKAAGKAEPKIPLKLGKDSELQ